MSKIKVISFSESKFNEDSPNIIRELLKLKYPQIAKFFYVNNKKKVSVYTTDAWGNLKVWNKGTFQFELCENMDDKSFFSLSELFQGVNSQTNLDSFKNTSIEADLTPIRDEPDTTEVVITNVTTVSNINSNEEIAPVAIKQLDVQINNEVEKTSLLSVFQKYLPDGYLINKYTPGEDHYILIYKENVFDEPPYWSVLITSQYSIGTVYTNSRSCANKVAQHLNKLSITPSNLNSYFSL